MVETIDAYFDGKSIVPDTPLELPKGQRLRIRLETLEPNDYPLALLAEMAIDMGMTDLAERHREVGQPSVEESMDE